MQRIGDKIGRWFGVVENEDMARWQQTTAEHARQGIVRVDASLGNGRTLVKDSIRAVKRTASRVMASGLHRPSSASQYPPSQDALAADDANEPRGRLELKHIRPSQRASVAQGSSSNRDSMAPSTAVTEISLADENMSDEDSSVYDSVAEEDEAHSDDEPTGKSAVAASAAAGAGTGGAVAAAGGAVAGTTAAASTGVSAVSAAAAAASTTAGAAGAATSGIGSAAAAAIGAVARGGREKKADKRDSIIAAVRVPHEQDRRESRVKFDNVVNEKAVESIDRGERDYVNEDWFGDDKMAPVLLRRGQQQLSSAAEILEAAMRAPIPTLSAVPAAGGKAASAGAGAAGAAASAAATAAASAAASTTSKANARLPALPTDAALASRGVELNQERRRRRMAEENRPARLRRMETFVQKQLLSMPEFKPYFIWTITIIQLILICVELGLGGLMPIGFGTTVSTGSVTTLTGATVTEQKSVSDNFWIGPGTTFLVQFGAKFTPCMRRDVKAFNYLTAQDTAFASTYFCCVTSGNCGMMTIAQCSNLGGTTLSIVGQVCSAYANQTCNVVLRYVCCERAIERRYLSVRVRVGVFGFGFGFVCIRALRHAPIPCSLLT
jgi:hypothetical protein